MRSLWILRIFYCLLLGLFLVTWIIFAIQGYYREIADDLIAIAFLAILWGSTEAYYKNVRKRSHNTALHKSL